MAQELLAQAREAAEKSALPVRAAALLRIARVETAFDRRQARRTLEQALKEIRQLPGRDGEFLLEHSRRFAAAVAPDLLREIPAARQLPHSFEAVTLGKIMLEHGHADAALDYVMQYDDAATFPFDIVSTLIERLGEDRRLAVFRRAIEAWREGYGDAFVRLFQYRWKLLPSEEAREVAREIVRVTLGQQDQQIHAGYVNEVVITSSREHTLFEILHVLRHLDGPMTESLLADHAQLAAAARRFPYGLETMIQEVEARKKPEGQSCGGFIMGGDPSDFPYLTALLQASRDGDFAPVIPHLLEVYRKDTAPESPNQVPREFWPSTCCFRTILYRAGKRLGPEAAVYLDCLADPDLRLFAQIELAASLAGLPEFQGVQREYRPRPGHYDALPHRRQPQSYEVGSRAATQRPSLIGASGLPVRCPICSWSPNPDDRWFCDCGHSWNTFETEGLCPECKYQWSITACLSCGESSPHADWYVKG